LELGNEIKDAKMPNKSKPWEKRWLREEKPLYLRYCPEEGNPTKYG